MYTVQCSEHTLYSTVNIHCTVQYVHCTVYVHCVQCMFTVLYSVCSLCVCSLCCTVYVHCTVQCMFTVLYSVCSLYCTVYVHCTVQCMFTVLYSVCSLHCTVQCMYEATTLYCTYGVRIVCIAYSAALCLHEYNSFLNVCTPMAKLAVSEPVQSRKGREGKGRYFCSMDTFQKKSLSCPPDDSDSS